MSDDAKTKKNKNILCNLDVYIACLCLIVLVVITFLGVFFRYVLSRPFIWLEEVQLMLLLWIGFITAGAAFRSGSHIAIEMVVDVMPPVLKRIVEWLDRVVVMAILLFLTQQCYAYFKLFVDNGRLTAVLRIPYAYIYAVMPITCVLMIMGFISHEVKAEKAYLAARKNAEEALNNE